MSFISNGIWYIHLLRYINQFLIFHDNIPCLYNLFNFNFTLSAAYCNTFTAPLLISNIIISHNNASPSSSRDFLIRPQDKMIRVNGSKNRKLKPQKLMAFNREAEFWFKNVLLINNAIYGNAVLGMSSIEAVVL